MRGDFERVKNMEKEQYLVELDEIMKEFNDLLGTYSSCIPQYDWRLIRISQQLEHLTQLEKLLQSGSDIPDNIVNSDIDCFREHLNGLKLVLEPEETKQKKEI